MPLIELIFPGASEPLTSIAVLHISLPETSFANACEDERNIEASDQFL